MTAYRGKPRTVGWSENIKWFQEPKKIENIQTKDKKIRTHRLGADG